MRRTEPQTNRTLLLGGPAFIIFWSFVIFHKFPWSAVILFIFMELIFYTLFIGCLVKLKEKYLAWKERRRRNRPQTVLARLENNLDHYDIVSTKDECIICLDSLDFAIQLKCGHVYHRHCIDRMIQYNIHLCPLCRAEMV